jgi:hypothetical protein
MGCNGFIPRAYARGTDDVFARTVPEDFSGFSFTSQPKTLQQETEARMKFHFLVTIEAPNGRVGRNPEAVREGLVRALELCDIPDDVVDGRFFIEVTPVTTEPTARRA